MDRVPTKIKQARFQSLSIASRFYAAIDKKHGPFFKRNVYNKHGRSCHIVFWLDY